MPKRKSDQMTDHSHDQASPLSAEAARPPTDHDELLQSVGAKFDRFVETLRDLLEATPSSNFALRPTTGGGDSETPEGTSTGTNEDKLAMARVLKKMRDKGKLTWLDGYADLTPDVAASTLTNGGSTTHSNPVAREDQQQQPIMSTGNAALDKLAQLATMAEVITALRESESETTWPPPLPQIHDEALLKQALTHRSYAFEQAPHGTTKAEMAGRHNERLEFLGDAVLYYICTKLLYAKFPEAREGELSILRSELIGNHTGCEMGAAYNLQHRLLLSEAADGEQSVRTNSKVVADTFEAYLGALLLDGSQGPQRCLSWLAKLMKPKIDAHIRAADVGEVDTLAKQRIFNHFGRHLPSNRTDPRYAQRGLPLMALQYVWVDGSGGNQGGFVTACKLGVDPVSLPSAAAATTTTSAADGDSSTKTPTYQPIELGRGWGPNKKEAEHRAAMDACKRFGLRSIPNENGQPSMLPEADPEGLVLTAKVLSQLLSQL